MNEIASKLKSSLTCSYCFKILKNPVELQCEHLICQGHLKEKEVVQENKIKCHKCKKEFQVKDHEFNLIKSIQKQIEDKIYLSSEELTLKQKIEESIIIFYELYQELCLNKTKLDLECHNHFQEIRFQLDLQRKKLKEKIDEIYMEMIDETKECEVSYLKNLDEKHSSSLKSFEIKSIDENLKDLEEAFRNPNFWIETIEENHQRQRELIRTLELKLDEMNQIKENLKDSIQFKSNVSFNSFNQDSFGQLKLIPFSKSDLLTSQILTEQKSLELLKLCKFNSKDKFKLLYRASRDGFGSNVFHSKCDDKPNTLTILKAKESSFIFGGFTTAVWDKSDQRKFDPNAFLFSLINKDNQPCKMKIKPNQHEYAIYCHSGNGPIFGLYGDICIGSDANTNISSFSNLGSSYKHPQYERGTNKAKSFLASSFQFQLSEIEVYQKE